MEVLKDLKPIVVNGFKLGDKTFGDVLCYIAETNGIRCALIMPKLSKHKDVAEIISSQELRTSLKLINGTKVKVLVKG